MPKRLTSGQLEQLVKRRKLGISTKISRSIGSKAGNSWAIDDVESNSSDELENAESVQIKCTSKVRVSFKFYRHRLADYSRAISEKAMVDFLQMCGALRGDSEKEIWLIDLGQEKVASKAEERTEFLIEYPEVDFDDLWEPKGTKHEKMDL